MCRDLEIADRRMTTAIKLVLAQAFVSGAPSLMGHLMGHGMLHHRPFAQGSSAALGPELGTPFVLERLILADRQGPAVPGLGSGALHALGTGITGTGRKWGGFAWAHRHALTAWTGHFRCTSGTLLSLSCERDPSCDLTVLQESV
jgi:hypothetical protein